jgi:hypothetical protein
MLHEIFSNQEISGHARGRTVFVSIVEIITASFGQGKTDPQADALQLNFNHNRYVSEVGVSVTNLRDHGTFLFDLSL